MLIYAIPYRVNALFIIEALKDTVATDHEEIEVVLEFETANLGVAYDNVGIASILLPLGLDVSEGSRDGEAAREHSQRPLHI